MADRVRRGIEACKAFVFVISPDSVSSTQCLEELEDAVALNKLIVPVVYRDAPDGSLPPAIADAEWVFLRDEDDAAGGIDRLVDALETLASASADNTVRLWDAEGHGQIGAPLTGHTDGVNGVAFSRDGTTLASAGDDKTVRLWDIASQRQLGPPLTDQTGAVRGVAFSPDGRTVASAGEDPAIRLWTNDPIDVYIDRLCTYIDARHAREAFRRAAPSIGYQQPCA